MSAFGVAFIGNIWALTMFGVGLLLRGYSKLLFDNPLFAAVVPGGDLNKAYIPHGMMVGAGVVALVQVGAIILRSRNEPSVISRRGRRRCVARWDSALRPISRSRR